LEKYLPHSIKVRCTDKLKIFKPSMPIKFHAS
jgi:hypothetical protein